MVKGITRRVIVVKAPDPRYFEEAIFIVREDVSLSGVDAETVLKEAQSVASGYVKHQAYRRGVLKHVSPLGYLAAGAVLSALFMTFAGFFLFF